MTINRQTMSTLTQLILRIIILINKQSVYKPGSFLRFHSKRKKNETFTSFCIGINRFSRCWNCHACWGKLWPGCHASGYPRILGLSFWWRGKLWQKPQGKTNKFLHFSEIKKSPSEKMFWRFLIPGFALIITDNLGFRHSRSLWRAGCWQKSLADEIGSIAQKSVERWSLRFLLSWRPCSRSRDEKRQKDHDIKTQWN